jgi:pyruvate dehydrogenase E2 component (dihydrolipoamide acetyltransferase)
LGIAARMLRGRPLRGRLRHNPAVPEDDPTAPPDEDRVLELAPTSPGMTGTAKGDVTIVELTRAQQTLARRVAEAKATVPEHTLSTEIDVEDALARLDGDDLPTLDALVVKAAGVALREFPRANASYRDNRFEQYSRVNVGLAMAAHGTVLAPTIFDADVKPLAQIGTEIRALRAKVENGTIASPELSGATFTVSNPGARGVTAATPILAAPQAAALAIGAAVPRPVAVSGTVEVHRILQATLTCDHRILYGDEAADFLQRIRALLEQPGALPA